MKDNTFYIFFLLIVVGAIVIITLFGIARADDRPRTGVWVNGECRFDLPYEAMIAAGYEPCPEVLHLYPDLDYETRKDKPVAVVPERQASPIPEPATIFLVGSGLVYLTIRRRKR